MKVEGKIIYRRDPVSYGPYGPHKAQPYKVVITSDPVNTAPRFQGATMGSDATYEGACYKLARELAWRDPKVRELKARAEELQEAIAKREYERLILLPAPTGD